MKVLSRLLRVVLATVISFMTLTVIAQTPAAAADGDLDTSWDTDGMKVTDLHQSGEDYITDILVQPDGKVLLSGSWNNNGQTGRYSWYQQLKEADGSNASDYTTGSLFWSPRSDQINQTLLDSDGKEVSVGWAGTNTGNGAGNFSNHSYDYDCAVIRKDNGVLDSSFSGNGKMFVTFSTSRNDYCKAVVIQSDGKIVVGGYVTNLVSGSNINQWTFARI
ncbi:MAG TPA: hypothetical protein EYG17_00835, partial [Acidimicrobiia bacterium]|nr:hypothetical protein [Acidimicrobiia bacterium]